jgi:hypothetical protein
LYLVYYLRQLELPRILESDRSIRFVDISNKMGNQIISRYRSGLTPLLTPQEIDMYAMQSVLRIIPEKIMNPSLVSQYTHLHYIRN